MSSYQGNRRNLINYRLIDTPIGIIGIAYTDRGIAKIVLNCKNEDRFLKRVKADFCGFEFEKGGKNTLEASKQIREYLSGKRKKFELPLDLIAATFAKKVYRAAIHIPYGKTKSYGEIASEIGSPKGARAVGFALKNNPIPIVIPCHRVIGSKGDLVGFAGGLSIKRKLLRLEAENMY